MRPARSVSLPWPPSSSLCLRSLVARISRFASLEFMITSPLIFGQPSWLVLAMATAPGSRSAAGMRLVRRRTIRASLVPQALGLGLVERQLPGHGAVVGGRGAAGGGAPSAPSGGGAAGTGSGGSGRCAARSRAPA